MARGPGGRVWQAVLVGPEEVPRRRVGIREEGVSGAGQHLSCLQHVPDGASQGCHPRSGPVPRRRPGDGPELLGAQGVEGSVEPEQHLQGARHGPGVQETDARRSRQVVDARGAHAQRQPHGARASGQLPLEEGLGELHRRRHPNTGQAAQGTGVPALGKERPREGASHRQGRRAPHPQVPASLRPLRTQGFLRVQALLAGEHIHREKRRRSH